VEIATLKKGDLSGIERATVTTNERSARIDETRWEQAIPVTGFTHASHRLALPQHRTVRRASTTRKETKANRSHYDDAPYKRDFSYGVSLPPLFPIGTLTIARQVWTRIPFFRVCLGMKPLGKSRLRFTKFLD
jgi:hypothetical protein